MCRGRSRPIRDFRRRTVPGVMCLELGKATLLHPLPVPSRLPGEPGCISIMHGPATALHIYVCTLEEGSARALGMSCNAIARFSTFSAQKPEEGGEGGGGRGESALKTPPNPPSNPFPSDCRCSSRPSAQGCGPGSVSAEGEALGGGGGRTARRTKQWHFFPKPTEAPRD